MERRVRAAVALEKGRRPRPDPLTRWLIAGAAVVTALSAFALISFVVPDDPAPAPVPPAGVPLTSGAITFAGTRTATETAAPPAGFSFSGSYYAPAK